MNRFHKLVVPLLAAAAIAYGCTQTIEEVQFIKLEETAYSFLGQGNGPCTIAVEASGDWDIEISAAWVRLVEKTAGNIVIEVDDNEASEDREAHIDFMCGDAFETVRVYQLGDTESEYMFKWMKRFPGGTAISPNGRYIGCINEIANKDGSYTYEVIIWDTHNNEEHVVASVPKSLFNLATPDAITDDGLCFVYDNSLLCSIAFDLDGEYFQPETISGMTEKCTVYAVSADGRIWTGCIASHRQDGSGGEFLNPVIWVDGKPELLPVPPLNYRDQPFLGGVLTRGMSHDGSVIYGSTFDNMDFGMLYWKKKADGGYEVDYVGQDVRTVTKVGSEEYNGEIFDIIDVCGMIVTNERMNCSPQGRYIAGTYRVEDRSGGGYSQREYPAFFNTETGKTTIFWDFDGHATTATDDGIGFITNASRLATDGSVVDIDNEIVLGSVREWVKDVYDYNVPGGYIDYVGPDGAIRGGTLVDVVATLQFVNWYLLPRGE